MGDLFSLFWETDPPKTLPLPIPNQEYECQKDDSCGAIGNFLLWYFVIILVVMIFSRTSVWISEKNKNDEDSGTSPSESKASKDTSYKQHEKDAIWDSFKVMKAKHLQLSPVTDSEIALVNAYLELRRARLQSQLNQRNQIQQTSDTTECDSEESNSEPSSWKESASEHHLSAASIKRRRLGQRQRSLGSRETWERPCLHCKARRTNEWLTRHFLERAAPNKGHTQERVHINTEFSKF
ncbi:serine-rich single-pass membrane protein 1 [Rhynchocyon petersi]